MRDWEQLILTLVWTCTFFEGLFQLLLHLFFGQEPETAATQKVGWSRRFPFTGPWCATGQIKSGLVQKLDEGPEQVIFEYEPVVGHLGAKQQF